MVVFSFVRNIKFDENYLRKTDGNIDADRVSIKTSVMFETANNLNTCRRCKLKISTKWFSLKSYRKLDFSFQPIQRMKLKYNDKGKY